MACLPLSGCSSDEGSTAAPPDVVIVLVDTLRADFTELNGYVGTTPHLKALAEESVVFEAAYSPGPWTLPSIASLFTGQHLVEHGVLHDRVQLPESATTFVEVFADAGYATGSFYRNPYAGESFGLAQGFDVVQAPARSTGPKVLADFWAETGDRPYLLYVHNAEPHDPLLTRGRFRPDQDPAFLDEFGRLVARYRSLTRTDWAKGRPVGTTDNTDEQDRHVARLDALAPEVKALYAASVRDADDRIGGIVEALRERGTWDRTLFIVLSDHGEEMGEHGSWQHDQSVYEELVHVPLLIHFPDGRHGGLRVDTPVSGIDLAPTLLEVAGLDGEDEPDTVDGQWGGMRITGRSLIDAIEGDAADGPRLMAMRHNQKKFNRRLKESRGDLNLAVRDGRWKAIVNVETGTVELYDLELDPGETDDRSEQDPERADRLATFATARYAELEANASSARSGGLLDADRTDLEGLRALGYLDDDE